MLTLGGFIGEEHTVGGSGPYHQTAALHTGRACLRFILERARASRVLVPFFTCDSVLDVIRSFGAMAEFYPIDRTLRPSRTPAGRGLGELFIAVNYFGLLTDSCCDLESTIGESMVVDDSQAFFRHGSSTAWSFNSARKFFGVPDGAYVYGPDAGLASTSARHEPSVAHLELRASDPRSAYELFQRHESQLTDRRLAMSVYAEERLRRHDYPATAARRRANYLQLDDILGVRNRLRIPLGPSNVPLYYPFLPERACHRELISRGVFVPRLWPEVLARGGRFDWERELSANLCPLPVDQRYSSEHMVTLAEKVLKLQVGA